jgi:pyridoxamine 5'-phosphate oxidase
MENLHDKRKVYEKSQLIESEIKQNPIEQFRDWFLEASESLISEANAMAFLQWKKMVVREQEWYLLKAYTHEGFIFYTNYNSRKGKAIEEP